MGLVGLATAILAARLLGAQGRGELAAIQLWPTTIAAIACAGVSEALVYHGARNRDRAGSYLASSLVYAAVAGSALAALAFWALPRLLHTYSSTIVAAAQAYFIAIPSLAVLAILYSALRGAGRIRAWNLSRSLPPLGWLATLTALLAAGTASAAAAATTYLVVLSALTVTLVATLARSFAGGFVPSASAFRGLIRFGLPTAPVILFHIAQQKVDQIVLVPVVDSAQLGTYVVALGWAAISSPLLQAIAALACERVASAGAAASRLFAETIRTSVIVAAATGVAVSLITPLALPTVFGAQFGAAVQVALVLVWGAVLGGLRHIVAEALRGLGVPARVLVVEVVSTLTTIVAVVSLAPRYGTMGSALGILSGALAGLLFAVLVCPGSLRHRVATFIPRSADILATFNAAASLAREGLRASRLRKDA